MPREWTFYTFVFVVHNENESIFGLPRTFVCDKVFTPIASRNSQTNLLKRKSIAEKNEIVQITKWNQY